MDNSEEELVDKVADRRCACREVRGSTGDLGLLGRERLLIDKKNTSDADEWSRMCFNEDLHTADLLARTLGVVPSLSSHRFSFHPTPSRRPRRLSSPPSG